MGFRLSESEREYVSRWPTRLNVSLRCFAYWVCWVDSIEIEKCHKELGKWDVGMGIIGNKTGELHN